MSISFSIPNLLLRQHRIVPLSDDGTVLELGTPEGLSPNVVDEIAFLTGRRIVTTEVDDATVDTFLTTLDGGESSSTSAGETGGANETPSSLGTVSGDSVAPHPRVTPSLQESSLQESGASAQGGGSARQLGDGSVVKQVERIITHAIADGASDIHIEPYEAFFRVRYRQDGVLRTVGELNPRQRDAIISRLKIMADLDIAEKRRPQDSRIRMGHDGRDVDLRVSTLPTAHGEKVVLRILDKDALSLDLDVLGLSDVDRRRFEEAIGSPTGQILVTGPTGSGKTTTLYAALSTINDESINITTIEDPIEYNLPGINQTRVRSDIGFTFSKALRAFLRQDPNVIMVGEIRDQETASIAVRAALTGHLVLSTLHTNDAPSTITRLVDMGVEPYLVAASVRMVVAQRLVRCVCPSCGEARPGDAVMLQRLGLPEDTSVVEGDGCEACQHTGFQGRTALFEIMPVSESIADLVSEGAPTSDLRRQALGDGLVTLREAAAEAVRDGRTTPAEVLREVTV